MERKFYGEFLGKLERLKMMGIDPSKMQIDILRVKYFSYKNEKPSRVQIGIRLQKNGKGNETSEEYLRDDISIGDNIYRNIDGNWIVSKPDL